MGFRERERQLACLYGVGASLSLVTIICSAVPWSHWEEILDTCVSDRCGCILYGSQTFRTFNGGDISVCYFATLASVPAFSIAIITAVYHGYRVCMFSKEENRTTARMTRRYGFIISYTNKPFSSLSRSSSACCRFKKLFLSRTVLCICFQTIPVIEHIVVNASAAIQLFRTPLVSYLSPKAGYNIPQGKW
jgi:hypothetical protein